MRKIFFIVLAFILVCIQGCQPPYISIYVLGDVPSRLHWVNLSTGGTYSIKTVYTMDSLNSRLSSSYSVDIYSYNLKYVTSNQVFLRSDSLYYTKDSTIIAVGMDSVRQLIIYDHSWTKRALVRAGVLGGFLGGLAALAYIPPNPPNEPPVSTVYVMVGSGAVIGIAVGDVASQREIVAFVKNSEFY